MSIGNGSIICKGFILRPPELDDLDSYHKYFNNPYICRNMQSIHYPLSKEDSRIFLEKTIKNNITIPRRRSSFVIDMDNECIGTIALSEIELNHKAKIVYWLGKDYWGKDIMTNAITLMTEYGFQEYNLKRIYAYVPEFNMNSAKLLERCGYTCEGILKMNRLKNGRYFDDYLYSIIRNDVNVKDRRYK